MGCSSSMLTSKPGTRFSAIKDQLKPLDLIAFRGADLVSDTISLLQKLQLGDGTWTHVGLVITPDIIPIKNAKPDRLYVWESTMSGKLGGGADSVETGDAVFGVQIRDLSSVIDRYDDSSKSQIGWFPLLNTPFDRQPEDTDETYNERITRIKTLLTDFHLKNRSTGYNYEIVSLCTSIFPECSCLSSTRTQCCGENKKLFCSQLVATIYQLIGILNSDVKPEHVSPGELVGQADDHYTVSDEIPILFGPPTIITREWPEDPPIPSPTLGTT